MNNFDVESEIKDWKGQIILTILILCHWPSAESYTRRKFPNLVKDHHLEIFKKVHESFVKSFVLSVLLFLLMLLSVLCFSSYKIDSTIWLQGISATIAYATTFSHPHPSDMSLGGEGLQEKVSSYIFKIAHFFTVLTLVLLSLK
ncbi:hypothetical protein [Desulfovibrio sp. JC022]|uniref:hypothetical protein n=1 Tax=Desulfovibrio sp. JC022 TaxID=2593642 RepID=UPI0013D676B2|nr:hypothetical protein [Desulfovibrio sp. JC022]NDV24302.1 hypothetical protein [Desulfovibrio sp. JC022]